MTSRASAQFTLVEVGHANDGRSANGIAVSGDHAYLANGTNGLRVYDLSNRANPANIAHTTGTPSTVAAASFTWLIPPPGTITSQRPPSQPPTAKHYTQADYPWFDYYDAEAKALDGSTTLARLKSVLKLGQEKRESPLPENASVSVTHLVNLRAGLQLDQVRVSDFS